MSLLLDALRRGGSGSRDKDYGYLYSAEEEADGASKKTVPTSRPRVGSDAFKRPARRIPRWVWLAGGGAIALAVAAGVGWYWLASGSMSGSVAVTAPRPVAPTAPSSPAAVLPVVVAPAPEAAVAAVTPATPPTDAKPADTLPSGIAGPAGAEPVKGRTPGAPKLSVSALSGLAPAAAQREDASRLAPAASPRNGQPPTPAKPIRQVTKSATAAGAGKTASVRADPAARTTTAMVEPAAKAELGFALVNAWAMLERGQWAEAEAEYRGIIGSKKVPEPDAVLGLAVALHRQKRWSEALVAYEASLRVWPGNPVASSAMLDILAHTNAVEAESRLKQWIVDRPQDAAALSTYGLLLGRKASWPEAVGVLKRARELEPMNGTYAYNLAVALDQTHRYAEAAAQYQMALSMGGIGGKAAMAIKARLADIAQMVRP